MRAQPLPILLALAGAGALLATTARAQAPRPRSTDYLTVAGSDDVRAAWVNPAGLGRVLEASVMAEVVVDRPGDDLVLSQYTLGLNSRGFSISYARDRTIDTAVVGMTRFALGLPFPRGALGIGVTLFRGGGNASDEGWDLGVGYRLARSLDLAATLRHISRPVVRRSELPITALVGASWRPVPGVVSLECEAAADDSGPGGLSDLRYRGNLRLSTRAARRRVHVVSGIEIAGGRLDRWVVGVALGTTDWLGLLGGASRPTGLGHLDRVSLTGVASRRAATAVR